ncbi:hypothetical protein HU200_004127 [Digitaria exilis]|uniref:1-phosphatidylinositol 4-kinase n=1 Tax=Digitaria exilis TaxID=1010633 RepID=A0A835KU21_9POAL|nr:hypothetical protein HU200_004127 [Digitaria exilis]
MSSAGVATLSPLEDQLALVPQCLYGPAQPLDSILIFLAVPGMPMVPMRVLDSESVASVKLRIQRFKGFVVTKQRLVFGGHELTRNSSRVRDYGLADGNVLHLVVRLADICTIAIETANGKKFKFQVEGGRKVGYLKNKIATETGEQVESLSDHRLVLHGKELKDNQLITDIAKDNAVVHVFVREPAKVRTQTFDTETVVTVVTPEDEGNIHISALNRTEQANHGHAPVEPIVVNKNVKLSPAIMEMIGTTISGLEKGYLPVMSAEGSGGVYFMKDQSGESNVAVFKPIDEEPMAENNPRGLPLSVDGEGLKRGTRVGEGALREVAAYLLDYPIDVCKSDDGNILVCQDGDHMQLIPIDHGYCFPEKCARVLHVSTMLLKKGAERGLTAYDIGRIMCRETVNRESEIEALIEEAEDSVLPETSEETFLETVSEIMDRYLDNML